MAIIGAGFGGLLTGARLRELGVESIRLIDKAADVGGTWYWNRYPGHRLRRRVLRLHAAARGARLHPDREVRARAPEIFAHCRRIAEHYDLYRDACLQTEVREIRWDAGAARWIITTDRGDAIRARFVCLANGFLQKPKLPGIPGIADVPGPHVPHQPLGLRLHRRRRQRRSDRLADKRVGIIGTGATAVQCVPHLARAAESALRVPAHPLVGRRPRQPADRSASGRSRSSPAGSGGASRTSSILTAGGVRRRGPGRRRLDQHHQEAPVDAVNDTAACRARTATTMELADFAKMEEIRARVDAIVDDRGDRRGAQALVRLVLQAAVLPRRVPADLQPPQRHPGRHPRQGRRADHRARGRRRRRRVRARLPDLRDRLRGRHGLHAAHRLRDRRPRRTDAHRQVGGRRADVARPARRRLPELLHREHRPVGLHRELPLPARRPGAPCRLAHRTGRCPHDVPELEATAGGRGRPGSHTVLARTAGHRRPRPLLHARLLQP